MNGADRPKFRYFLKSDASTYYYVGAGSVLTTTTPTPLQYDPIEWSELDLRWKRHERYSGIFRQFVVPMSFTKDAATILRHVCYTQEGIESKCTLYIEKKKERTSFAAGDESYEFYYSGDIDFSQKHDTLNYFQASILDSGLAALLQANDRTPYEIPVYAGDCIPAHLDGMRLKNTTFVTLANDITAGATWHQMQPTMLIRTSESQIKVDVIEQPNQQGLGTALLITDFPFFQASIDGTVVIDYDISVLVGNSAGSSLATKEYRIRITKWDGTTATPYDIFIEPTFTNYVGHTNHATGTISIPVLAGESLVYFAGLFSFNLTAGSDAFLIDQSYDYSTLTVHYDTKLDASVVRCYRYWQFFQKMVAELTGGLYGAYSDFLTNPNLITSDNKPWNTLVTSGDGLRRLAWLPGFWAAFNFLSTEKIKTTFDDLNTDASNRWMTGIGIETIGGNQVLRMEHLSHFFDDSAVIVNVGEVTKVDVSVGLEYIYNLLKIGYNNEELDALNGKDDPFTTQSYSLPIVRKQAEWNMVSPYVASMYAIEFQRANLTDKKTTDSDSDNKTFLIEVADNPISITIGQPIPYSGNAYPLARKQNLSTGSAVGILSPDTAFNLSLTPKHNFNRNGARIHTSTHQQDSKVIRFTSSEKSADLESNLGSGTVKERDDVAVSGLSAPLFLPIIFQFETMVPTDLPALIEQNPYGKIQFTYLGNQYEMFILEAGIKPADNAVYTWKGLCAPNVDLSKLIH